MRRILSRPATRHQRHLHGVAYAFTGLATYDDFAVIDPDMSEILLLTSPFQTPLLDLLPQPIRPVTSPTHYWTEQQLGPDRIIASTAINSATAATGVQVNGLAHLLQVGMLLEIEAGEGNREITQIASIPGPNSLLLTRNVGLSGVAGGVNSLAAGGTLFVISTAAEEGSETTGDTSRPRVQLVNYTQIFKKEIKISGTRQAVLTAPNVGSEIDNQETLRTIELIRDLEKAVIRSVAVHSIGADDQVRTMNGLRAQLTSINSAVNNSSFVADPLLYVNTLLQRAWNAGARDLNVLLVGEDWASAISGTNASKLQVEQTERGVERLVEYIITDFGAVRKILSPWADPKSMMGLATGRIFVTPMTGRNIQRAEMGRTGDNLKRHILGEYTLEVHRQDQMFQARHVS